MINVLADQYLYNIQSFFPSDINLELYDPADGLPENLNDVHALLIRTVNAINKHTLPNIPANLRFIATGSAGTDHVDQQYLDDQGVYFASAAGCNARSVAEYIATALLIWSDQNQQELSSLSTGIVGVGHVGTEVNRLLKAMGVSTVCYDPPRAGRENSFASASLEEVLSCDILTCHTPLTRSGDYPTYHWLDEDKLNGRHFNLIINAARGGVVSEDALLKNFEEGNIDDFILDVWEQEPEIRQAPALQAFIKTPHIAGYSIQAKTNASRIIADELLEYFDLPVPRRQDRQQPGLYEQQTDDSITLSSLMANLHPILEYDAELHRILDCHYEERGSRFNRLRGEYPLRQEFSTIHLPRSLFHQFPVLKPLGFSVRDSEKP